MDYKKERHNEISKLCERRKREWKKISKTFLDILLDEKNEKKYKTDAEKKKTMLKCVNNWIENNRERFNYNMRKCMRWKSISNIFLKILL
jgi:hypothetical protein